MTENPLRIRDAEWEVMRTVWAHEGITSKDVVTVLEKKTGWKAATIKILDVLSRVCNKQSGKMISNMIAYTSLSKVEIAELKS